MEDVFMDGNIAGMAPDVASIVNCHGWGHQLDPYMGSVEFEDDKLELTGSAYFKRGRIRGREDAGDCGHYRRSCGATRYPGGGKGEGYPPQISGDAVVHFEQEL